MKRLTVKGVRQHNLKGFDIEIELGTICGISGPSGAGKSSLVFDTIYSEAQRRFIETFSPYARQFLERLPRAKVEALENLPAAIGIGQANPVRNSRSTVATLSEISFTTRMLFYKNSVAHCSKCNCPIMPASWQHVWEFLADKAREGARIGYVCIEADRQGLLDLVQEGYRRILQGGKVVDVGECTIRGDDKILVVIDRIPLAKLSSQRIQEAVENGFSIGGTRILVAADGGRPKLFSKIPVCQRCGTGAVEPTLLLFSFNSPEGACHECSGFGRVMGINWDLVIPDASVSIIDGAIRPLENWHDDKALLLQWCRRWGLDAKRPWRELTDEERKWVIHGKDEWYGLKAIFDWLETKRYKAHIRILLSRYRAYERCPACNGARFGPAALAFRLGGKNISEFYRMSVDDALKWVDGLGVVLHDKASQSLLEDLGRRLSLIQKAGLGYLSLDRQSRTLSGGELSRLCLAKGVSVSLSETLFCLEEPSSGLHPKDVKGVRQVIEGLREQGNTVLMTENDHAMLACCDRVVELGPGSGMEGGNIVADKTGTEDLATIARFDKEGLGDGMRDEEVSYIYLEGIRHHNLKTISCRFPVGLFTCVCGVSGSGKSTLVEDCLYRGMLRRMGIPCEEPGSMERLEVPEGIEKVVFVDQEPLSRTPRGCPGTYLKVLDQVRKLFVKTKEAKVRGLRPGYFSLNVDGGRCPECKGQGFEVLEMQFLPDVFVPCPECKGSRFAQEALEISLYGKNFADCLDMSLEEASRFFCKYKAITRLLDPAIGLGLGHLLLGQPLNTLSCGEAQRLKLARCLSTRSRNTLFILDEPTRGLHPLEISSLAEQLSALKNAGNTIVVVEHDLSLILSSDWVIELGPEGGERGGEVLFQGPSPRLLMEKTPTAHAAKMLSQPEGDRMTSRGEEVDRELRSNTDVIQIRGARHHNLKDIDLDIPRNKLVVVTGVSGSGKSSLAFDIIFKEAQRRYLESLPSYMKQFVRLHERADCDAVRGLSPSVAIEQKAARGSSMSTVATLSEVAHYLRLMYTHCSRPVCPGCGSAMEQGSREEMLEKITELCSEERPFYLGAPRVRRRKGWHQNEITRGFKTGADLVMVDGRLVARGDVVALSRYREHDISWLWGPVVTGHPEIERLVEKALEAGKGSIFALLGDDTIRWFSLKHFCKRCGLSMEEPDPLLFSFHTRVGRCPKCHGTGSMEGGVCQECKGSRLNRSAALWQIDSVSLERFMALEIDEARQLLGDWLKRPGDFGQRSELFLSLAQEVDARLELMSKLGLGYLRLDRAGNTLSGGEAQRISLCAQSGSNLTGITVVLDEPTIGLHPSDNKRLIKTLKDIRDKGNSVIVVEHDQETIIESDYVIDLGPGGGKTGGQVVFQGTPEELLNAEESKTAQGFQKGEIPLSDRISSGEDINFITFRDLSRNNLRGIEVTIPAGAVTVVTGVSGSGKTSLKEEILSILATGDKDRILRGSETVQGTLHIDHNPIGRSPRSCPATFLGIFTHIRALFSRVPAARMKGFGPSRFSFNTTEGACPNCNGQGQIKQSLGLLPDVYVKCQACMGRRYRPEVLTVKWRSKDISQILSLTASEALQLFKAVPAIRGPLRVMDELGLGYIELGQPSPTLSGGEAQRLKIAKELAKAKAGGKLYLLDEPSIGLHMEDVGRLANCLARLAQTGNTVLTVEHDLSMISRADWIIDLGPGGGRFGGKVLFQGPVDEFVRSGPDTKTRICLREYLSRVRA